MRSIKQIALVTIITLGVFCAALYSSSCSKDACKATTCLNKGNCAGGICNCPDTGTGGANCEIIYRTLYTNKYAGVAYDNMGNSLPNDTLVFTAGNDSTYTKMTVKWQDKGVSVVEMPITLTISSSSGSNFTITPITPDTVTYTGSGTVNEHTVSLNLVEQHPHSPWVYISLNNFNRQ